MQRLSATTDESAELLRRARGSIDCARGSLRKSGAAAWRESWIPLRQAAAEIQALNQLLRQAGGGAGRELLQPALELRHAIRELSSLLESGGGYTAANGGAASETRGSVVSMVVEG